MPNNARICATHTCNVDIPGVPPAARTGHLFPHLGTSLLSIGQLCDHGCTATFNRTSVSIQRNNKTILTGFRDPHTNLWCLPITSSTNPAPPPTQQSSAPNHLACNAYQAKTQQELVQFLHAA
jgi:hypothetical protein